MFFFFFFFFFFFEISLSALVCICPNLLCDLFLSNSKALYMKGTNE